MASSSLLASIETLSAPGPAVIAVGSTTVLHQTANDCGEKMRLPSI